MGAVKGMKVARIPGAGFSPGCEVIPAAAARKWAWRTLLLSVLLWRCFFH